MASWSYHELAMCRKSARLVNVLEFLRHVFWLAYVCLVALLGAVGLFIFALCLFTFVGLVYMLTNFDTFNACQNLSHQKAEIFRWFELV